MFDAAREERIEPWRWIARLAVTLPIIAGWLAMTLASLAYLLPADPSGGVDAAMPLAGLLAMMTLLYWGVNLPPLLVPMNEDDLFTWFVFAVYGYLLCLLGAVVALWQGGLLHFTIPLDDEVLPPKLLAFLLSGMFLTTVAAALIPRMRLDRRVLGLALVIVGWLAFEAPLLVSALAAKSEPQSLAPTSKLAAILGAALYLVLVIALVFPNRDKLRWELLTYLVLFWLFLVSAVLGWLLLHQYVGLNPAAEHQTANWRMFLFLVATMFLAPLIGWLGAPWTQRDRFGWLVLFVAAIVVLSAFLGLVPVRDDSGVIEHCWKNYDGPRLLESPHNYK